MSKNEGTPPSTYEGWFRYHSVDGLFLEEELAMMVAEAEGRQPILKLTEWYKDKSQHAGAPDLTETEES